MTDICELVVSEDAYLGDAAISVQMDRLRAQTFTVTALQGKNQAEALTMQGAWGPLAHTVMVTFLNDAWGGTPATDRNAYIRGMNVNGVFFACSTALVRGGQCVGIPIPAGACGPLPAPPPSTVSATPTFEDLFATADPARFGVFDGHNWPPLPGAWKWTTQMPNGWPSNSGTQDPASRCLLGSRDGQEYRDENVSILPGGGALLKALRKVPTTPGNFPNLLWSSGCLAMARSMGCGFGLYRTLVDLPQVGGCDAAVWMLPNDGGWAWEIDGLEKVGLDETNKITQAEYRFGVNNNNNSTSYGLWVPGDTSGTTLIEVLVTPAWTYESRNGVPVGRLATPTNFASSPTTMACMQFGLAIGAPGSWQGEPDPSLNEIDMVVREASFFPALAA